MEEETLHRAEYIQCAKEYHSSWADETTKDEAFPTIQIRLEKYTKELSLRPGTRKQRTYLGCHIARFRAFNLKREIPLSVRAQRGCILLNGRPEESKDVDY